MRQTLVGAAELQQALGVSRQRITQITTHRDFPEAVVVLRMGKIWDLADVQRWADERGRTLLPLDAPSSSSGSTGDAKESPSRGS